MPYAVVLVDVRAVGTCHCYIPAKVSVKVVQVGRHSRRESNFLEKTSDLVGVEPVEEFLLIQQRTY